MKAISLLLFALAPAIHAADSYVIQTIAGTSNVGDNGPAAAALLTQPEGITIDALGNVYIADAGDNRVRKIGSNGTIHTIAGNGSAGFSGDGGPATAAQLNHPYGIALDLKGNLFIADLGNARVRRVDASGVITSVAGGGTIPPSVSVMKAADAHLASPRNVALDPAGNLYISDFDAHQVYKVDSSGRLSIFAGSGKGGYGGDGGAALQARLSYPAGLAADALGNVYIADSGNSCIRRVWYGAITTIATKIPAPTGVAVDAAGRLYVASRAGASREPDTSSDPDVRVVASEDVASDAGGTLYLTAQNCVQRIIGASVATIAGGANPDAYMTGATATATRLAGPVAVAQSASGDLYIVEQSGNRIRKIAGNGAVSIIIDDSKQLKRPSGIAVDASGTIYFTDTGNNAVRRISTAGVLSTVAQMLSSPTCLRLGMDGSLYICDTGNDRILRIAASGSQTLAASVTKPSGLAVAADGSLYVSTAAQVVKFSPAGDANTVVDQLSSPAGLAIDSVGALIIAEAGKNRILKLGAAGAVTVLAGAGPAGLSGDNGPASAAQLNNPNDVAIDSAGNILIADAGNNRIRKLTAAQIAADITAPPPTSPAATTPVAVTVVNAASLLPGPVAPNEIITVFGSGFDPAHTQVMFDNVSASLFYAGAMQLNVLAPASLRPNSSVVLNVLANGVVVGTATVNTTSASPAIFTTKGGIGPAAALNQDSSVNSDIDPAPRGNIVSLFLTGDGQVAGRASATIGGYDCDVFYAGPAPGFPGLMQVNIRVPGGFLSPGDQPVLVTLNGVSTQPGVTLAIR